MMSQNSIRTAALLDQSPLWLEALELVAERLGIEVVGRTMLAEEAVSLVKEYQPAILLAGMEPSSGNGYEPEVLLPRMRQVNPELKAIVISTCADSEYITKALATGAAAYVLRSAHPDDLAAAIRQAFEHSIYLPSAGPFQRREAQDDSLLLSRREIEVLQLVAEGRSNTQVAKMLWISEPTVKFHLSNIYRKLQVSNRTEASRWAQAHKLLPPRQSVMGAA